ncbi:MAG: hypothetical protein M3461_09845 [Pseudomonadota bacterium]|nr:hypothetical protein [Pseudomonadota bacterium]
MPHFEGGGVDYRPRLGFVYFVHVDVGPVLGEVALADGRSGPASGTRRRRRDGTTKVSRGHYQPVPIPVRLAGRRARMPRVAPVLPGGELY